MEALANQYMLHFYLPKLFSKMVLCCLWWGTIFVVDSTALKLDHSFVPLMMLLEIYLKEITENLCKLETSNCPQIAIWLGFPGSSAGKESACNAGDPSSIPGSGRSAREGKGYPLQYSWASLVAQSVKNPPTMRETWVWSLGWEEPLEEGMTTHSSIQWSRSK